MPADAEINSSESNIPTSDARNAPMHTYAVSDASTHGANKLLYTYTSILPFLFFLLLTNFFRTAAGIITEIGETFCDINAGKVDKNREEFPSAVSETPKENFHSDGGGFPYYIDYVIIGLLKSFFIYVCMYVCN